MELTIKVVTVFDEITKKSAFSYALNLIDGHRIIEQKNLEKREKIFPSKNKKESDKIFLLELNNFISSVKKEYNVNKLSVFYKNQSFVKEISDKNVEKITQLNPAYWSPFITSLYSDLLNNNISPNKIKNVTKIKIDPTIKNEVESDINHVKDIVPKIDVEIEKGDKIPNQNRSETFKKMFGFIKSKTKPQNINEKTLLKKNSVPALEGNDIETKIIKSKKPDLSIDDFIIQRQRMETVQSALFEKKIKERTDIKNVFIDFAYHLETNRKRSGIVFRFYANENDMLRCKNQFHTSESISHGEVNSTLYRAKKELTSYINKIQENNKNVSLNLVLHGSHAMKQKSSFENLNINEKIEITSYRTKIKIKTKIKIQEKLNKDISIYLKELKNKNNVAVFTDGSVNESKKCSGSGVVIMHEGNKKLLASRNEGHPDSNYAEFMAVCLACREVSTNKDYKNKKIIIVSDNDLMSFSIRNTLSGIEQTAKRPHLKEICDLIKKNNLNIYFHNVKSHIHEKIIECKQDELYDFHHNNTADYVAGAAAGKELTAKQLKQIEKDTYHEKKPIEKNSIEKQSIKKEINDIKAIDKKPRRIRNPKKTIISNINKI